MIYDNIFFSAHVVNIWNNLPNSIVNASTVNAFKARLKKRKTPDRVSCYQNFNTFLYIY